MKAAVLVRPGEIILVERAACHPGPGEIGIAVSHVGICGSDLARFEGRMPVRRPVVFGHELSGQVTALGDGVTGFEVGQPVTVAPLLSCGACRFCQMGHEHLCPERRIFGDQVDGALQEHLCMPGQCVYPLPEHISLPEGALIEPLAVAVHAVRQADEIKDRRVGVLGAGAIGLLIIQVARAWGAEDVVAIDILVERLRMAEELGCTTVINSKLVDPIAALPDGVDVIFEATGSPGVAGFLVPMLAAQGIIVVVGRMEEPVPLDLDGMLLKEAQIRTSRYFTLADFRDAVRLLGSGAVSVTPLIQDFMSFNRLADRKGTVIMDAARQVVRLLIEFDNN
jgi:2-desacetyl-2-hydroxyethyl bacteriochlorophyllide A dehydrogenase